MAPRSRRTDALTKDQIVTAAMRILDCDGADALTFRRLAADLGTGSGALYWHIAGKQELLEAAAEAVLTPALATTVVADPRAALRTFALAIFDTIDAHPWVGTQLTSDPSQEVNLLVAERIGSAVAALNPPAETMFDAGTTVLIFILGAAAQNAANARTATAQQDGSREDLLCSMAERWSQLDGERFPYLHSIAPAIADHDDREQFLAGLDLILAGIATLGARSTPRARRQPPRS